MKLYKPLLLLLNNFSFLTVGTLMLPKELAHANVELLEENRALNRALNQVVEQVPQPQNSIAYGSPGLEHTSQADLLAHLYAIEKHLMGDTDRFSPETGFQTNFHNVQEVHGHGLDFHLPAETYSHITKLKSNKRKNEEAHINSVSSTIKKEKHLKSNPEMCKSSLIDRPSSSNIQGISEQPNCVAVSKESEESRLLDMLHEEGNLILQANPRLHHQIASDLGTLLDSFFARYGNGQQWGYGMINLPESVEKIKTDIVTRYFGGLMVIFHDVQKGPSSKDLLADGWRILYQELNMAIFSPYNEFYNLAGPKNGSRSKSISKNVLLEDILKLRLNSTIPSSLVPNLIEIWAKETPFTPHKYGINLEEFLISKKIPMPKGQKRKRKAEDVSQDYTVESYSTLWISMKKKAYDPKNHIKQRLSSFLIYFGRVEVRMPRTLLEKIKTFFVSLEKDILHGLPGMGTKITNKTSTVPIMESESIKERVHLVMKNSNENILPAFLAILWLTHQEQVSEIPWEYMCRSGWDFLEGYFSAWKQVLLGNPNPVIGVSRKKLFTEIDWSNASDTINYLAFLPYHGHMTLEPVWELADGWYDTLKRKEGGVIGALGHMVYQPSRSVIQRIYQHILGEKRGSLHERGDESHKHERLPYVHSKPGRVLVHFGTQRMKKQNPLWEQIGSFFKDLQTVLLTALRSHSEHKSNLSRIGSVLNDDMIYNSIKIAQQKLTPQFMALLMLIHADQNENKKWKAICESGWKFLKNYFSEWIDLLISDPPHSISLPQPREIYQLDDWSSSKDVFQYISKACPSEITSMKPAWFLVEQWYEKIIVTEGGTFISLGFHLSPPNKAKIRNIIKELEINQPRNKHYHH
ncbi:uncharacterized protein MELLADRAFT_106786 [Melampsora larici-populina 98AG31]|uniref:Secreted protein n=1 Tax=Melampsora larici-populina (strain 98AG31 / pathotype 3-4-7) TaxID=747676 RepID=F4RMM6_MELLP|nr:uncharacterized protein MELLADRAFT_106786 [Melampsora larici-populina 98AG31]EGG06355.1 hypothetical protein MELLADRAFT_106786 [Melampsora larici-populina 98AG31]